MNNTNITNNDHTSKTIDLISNIIGSFGIGIICSIGFLINAFILYLLWNKNLKFSFYQHVKVITVIGILICLLGIGYMNNICIGCQIYFRYEIICYRLIYRVSIRIILMISSLQEIYLITNRYFALTNRNNWFVSLRMRFHIPFLVIFPILLGSPYLLMVKIVPSKEYNGLYYWAWTDIAKTNYFIVYFLLVLLFENILPLIILLTMSILSHYEYKKRIGIKSKITIQSINNLKKLENSYTRITIILTVIIIISRIFDFVIGLSIRGIKIFNLKLNENTVSTINLIRQIVFLLYFGLHSINGILYVQADKNLRILAKEQLSKMKYFILYYTSSII